MTRDATARESVCEMLLRPFRIAPMMYGGALYPPRRAAAQPTAIAQEAKPDLAAQLRGLKALQDDGALTPEEFQIAKRKVLDQ
jgi:hypothetical protein